ncbi:MAG: hypothetical protein AAF907_08310, partial [Planctomycetota bacterium]
AATLLDWVFGPESTGREVRIGGTDLLRKEDLSQFWTIYVANVPRLPADAIGPLTRFGENGFGLIWYGGELDADHYTNALYPAGLFPVPLAGSSVELRADAGSGPDARFAEHPVNQALTVGDNLVADRIVVRRFLPVAADWERDDGRRNDGVTTVATLRDGSPLALVSTLGAGRILTVLTTADPAWTDWPSNIAFPLFQVPAQEWAARSDTGDGVGVAGESLDFALDATRFRPDILVEQPDDISATLTATPRRPENLPESGEDEGAEEDGSADPAVADDLLLFARYKETDLLGVYKVKLTTAEGEPVDRWTALNFPPAEGRLGLIPAATLTEALSGTQNVSVQEAGDTAWTGGDTQTREIRWWLLGLMAFLMAAESLLAYRCGYHGAGA